jgi:hypothetical protein
VRKHTTRREQVRHPCTQRGKCVHN